VGGHEMNLPQAEFLFRRASQGDVPAMDGGQRFRQNKPMFHNLSHLVSRLIPPLAAQFGAFFGGFRRNALLHSRIRASSLCRPSGIQLKR